MTGNYKLGLAFLIAFSNPVSSQRLFSRSRGNLLRQAAVARNAQLVEKDAAFDELEQLTLGDSDRSSSFPDVARSSPVSESAAFLPVEPARSQPIPVGQLSQSQPILVNQPQHSGQPRQVRVSAVPQAQPSSFTPSYSSGAPTPSQIRSLGPSGSSQVSSQSAAADSHNINVQSIRPSGGRQQSSVPVSSSASRRVSQSSSDFANFAPVDNGATQAERRAQPTHQPRPVGQSPRQPAPQPRPDRQPAPQLRPASQPTRQPVGDAYSSVQQQPQNVVPSRRVNDNVRTFIPGENPLFQGKQQILQQLPQEESLSPGKSIAQDFLPTCPDDTFSYIIPSPVQCDLYYLCEFGTPSRKVCDDGLVFSIDDVKCVAAERAKCEGRPQLQSPKGTGACTRRNGVFYTNQTCTDFVTCRDNHPSFGQCADGLVFDPVNKICAWADEALRPGCLPEDLLGFRCPNPKLTKEQTLTTPVYLRFGDHDRFADEKDCRFFFMCLTTGQPRRAGCGNGKVFDRSTGICKAAKDVPECADYYGQQAPVSTRPAANQDSRLLLIQDDLSKQFQSEHRRSQQRQRIKRWILEEEAVPEGR